MQNVQVVSVEDAGFYSCAYTSGSTVKVTLKCGNDIAICDGILLWDNELATEDLFDEWVALAMHNEEGYCAFITDDNGTTMYGK